MPTTRTATSKAKAERAKNIWSDEERAAMREGARERKASARLSPDEERAAGEREVSDKIDAMPEPDRSLARRIHEIVTTTAPTLAPRTYYGMPAYALAGKTLCFFKPAVKFKERYASFGFEQTAKLDDGTMWPTSYAITSLTAADEATIAGLVRKAIG